MLGSSSAEKPHVFVFVFLFIFLKFGTPLQKSFGVRDNEGLADSTSPGPLLACCARASLPPSYSVEHFGQKNMPLSPTGERVYCTRTYRNTKRRAIIGVRGTSWLTIVCVTMVDEAGFSREKLASINH